MNKAGLGTRAEYLGPTDLATLESGQQVFVPWSIWWDFAPQQLLPETTGNWAAMRLPAWEDGGSRSGAMGGASFVIPKDAENGDLAWLFYEFLAFDPEGYAAVYGPNDIYPNGLNTSIPAYSPAADPATPLFGPIDGLGGQDLWTTAIEAGNEIPGSAPIPQWWAGAVDYLGNNLQRMFDGDLTPEQVIEQSTEEIQTNLIDRS
ncbi:extracellular solute-binding protein [Glaciibacter superstes]|uniref:extracellular solute-binding protein n=1 Tax=Glaciibacter superstes TaxID=501023 RepID=UPI0004240FD6|nr:extracellular solute-binding protein [Glaciibacter superstes]